MNILVIFDDFKLPVDVLWTLFQNHPLKRFVLCRLSLTFGKISTYWWLAQRIEIYDAFFPLLGHKRVKSYHWTNCGPKVSQKLSFWCELKVIICRILVINYFVFPPLVPYLVVRLPDIWGAYKVWQKGLYLLLGPKMSCYLSLGGVFHNWTSEWFYAYWDCNSELGNFYYVITLLENQFSTSQRC